MLTRTLILFVVSISLCDCLLKTSPTESALKRKSKGSNVWGDDFEPYEAVNDDKGHDDDHCDCKCEKKSKTMAIVIPKYKFVDVPMAKEIPHKEFEGKKTKMKTVEIKGHHEEEDDHDDDEDEKYFDSDDEHNHKMIESMHLKRSESLKTTSSTTSKPSPFRLFKG